MESDLKRAAIYVRVSTAGQEEDGTSLATQEECCRDYAAQRGYSLDAVQLYREVHTGTDLWERPQLQRLRETMRRHEVDVAIAYAIDRLSRDPVHLGVVISEAEHAGVDVQFVSEPLDNSPEGQLIRFVRGYAAKVEHQKITERSIRGRRARVEAGLPLAGPRPIYGYRWRPDEILVGRAKPICKPGLEVDPLTAPIVGRIFADAAVGKPLRRIARELTADGIAKPSGNGLPYWHQTSVHCILTNPAYAGRAAGWRMATARDRKYEVKKALQAPVA